MRRVFADSLYWIALTYPRDQWHGQAVKANQTLHGVEIVTTEEVLTEFLATFRHNPTLRRAATDTVDRIRQNPDVIIRQQSHQSFLDGYTLYKSRNDKRYSLTDCISMEAMREEGIVEVLTHDGDFRQEGFTILL
jgi:predicted nucleic acid-binding protein